MVIARLLGILLTITLGVTLILLLITRDRKWLRIFSQVLVTGIIISLIFLGIYVLERFLLMV